MYARAAGEVNAMSETDGAGHGAAHGASMEMAAAILAVQPESIPEVPLHRARQCLLDYLGVTLGASREPAVSLLLETAHAM